MNQPLYNNFDITGYLHNEDALKDKQMSRNEPQTVYKEDALEAVKLDPAVLEAQITVTAKDKTNVKPPNNSKEDTVENEEPDLSEAFSTASSRTSFERIVSMQEAALLSLTPEQLEFLLTYTDSLRKKRNAGNKHSECAFCKKNGESISWYTGHGLKDSRGRVLCPVLRGLRCPRCGATGDRAHTNKYCPENISQK